MPQLFLRKKLYKLEAGKVEDLILRMQGDLSKHLLAMKRTLEARGQHRNPVIVHEHLFSI